MKVGLFSSETLRSAPHRPHGRLTPFFYRQILKKRTKSQQKYIKKKIKEVSAQAINTLKELEMALKTRKV